MLLRKLSLFLVPALLLGSYALPGRAQEDQSARYTYADTTLLRDTLGLTFRGLFRLADSLEVSPDTLRALSIRHRLPLTQLVGLADSLHVPVDSVGVILERERFNPLAARTAAVNTFVYSSTYNLQQTRSSWTNQGDYNFVLGALFLQNKTTIQLDRIKAGAGNINLWQKRDATTEVGWRLNPDYSLGGRVVLDRFDSDDPSSGTVAENVGEYQLSARTRQRPSPGVSSELNVFAGGLNLDNANQRKRGLSAEANGRAGQKSGRWFVHEMRGSINGSFSNVDLKTSGDHETSRDVIGNLNGNLSLFSASRVGLKSTYALSTSDVGQPSTTTLGEISRLKSNRAAVDAALRSRFGRDGYVSVTERLVHNTQVTALNGSSTRNTNGVSVESQTTWMDWAVEGRFKVDFIEGETPEASATGGFGERTNQRLLEGSLTRRFFNHLSTRIEGRIGLNAYRYHVIGTYPTPPITRDEAQQSYLIDGTYTFSEGFVSGVTLDVGRDQLVRIPSASTAANNTLRSYHAEWRWTYRLMNGLTATQRNTLGANYTSYNFLTGADRVQLDFGTVTTLNTVLTPHLSFDLSHSGQIRPSGGWARGPDGLYYYQPANESRVFLLSGTFQYTPTPAFSLTLSPGYRSSDDDGTVNGVSAPLRESRNLNFVGSANLNLPVGSNGMLTGSFGRTYFTEGTTKFSLGVPTPSPRSDLDYWTGTLQFSWRP